MGPGEALDGVEFDATAESERASGGLESREEGKQALEVAAKAVRESRQTGDVEVSRKERWGGQTAAEPVHPGSDGGTGELGACEDVLKKRRRIRPGEGVVGEVGVEIGGAVAAEAAGDPGAGLPPLLFQAKQGTGSTFDGVERIERAAEAFGLGGFEQE